MLLSGIVLWWPKKRKDLKNRIKIKWNAKWRRVNYDWHNVTTFRFQKILKPNLKMKCSLFGTKVKTQQ